MQQTNPPLSVGVASYPPAYEADYYAPAARIDREYREYIKARIDGDTAVADRAHQFIDMAIDAAVAGV